jgi:hypothetical protein
MARKTIEQIEAEANERIAVAEEAAKKATSRVEELLAENAQLRQRIETVKKVLN